MKNIFCFLFMLCLVQTKLWAQATTIIYDENFNSGPGGWVIGGFRPSWSYGIPSLLYIASNGTNCFATGDGGAASTEPFAACLPVMAPTTTGNYYNCCERSFVESPIIDLSGVYSPVLSLDINLHCEQTFDGAKAQISINGGQSWLDIGSYNNSNFQVFPNALNCREKNWYNKNNITYLSGTSGGCAAVSFSFGGGNSGWSGGCAQAASGACLISDNHGTNGWVTASLCIPQAANKATVKIRVAFGSGSQVYSDGIAIDNVKIMDVYPVVNFTGNQAPGCFPAIQFNNATDCGETWDWNFGHPGSPGNSSAAINPLHEFPAAGTFDVTLTATDFCGGTASHTQQVTVSAGDAPEISGVLPMATQLCDSASGTLSISLSQMGAPPYAVTYVNNNQVVTTAWAAPAPVILTGLYPGSYSSISITDSNGCEDVAATAVVIPYTSDDLVIEVYGDTMIQPGDSTKIGVAASIPSSYVWQPSGSLSNPFDAEPIASPLATTTYTVIATDSNGCMAAGEVTVFVNDTQPCSQYFFPNSFTPNGDGKNDLFQCFTDPAMEIEKFNMTIFDRWGRPVFQTENESLTWNGKNVQEGIYAVIAEFGCRNKKTSRYTGTLTLIK